jgi:hypothetical protein
VRVEPSRFDGALQIVRLNWPFYAMGAAVLLGWPAIPWSGAGGGAIAAAGWLVWSATLWWMAASIAASHWVYDRSKLYTWTWVQEILPRTPQLSEVVCQAERRGAIGE